MNKKQNILIAGDMASGKTTLLNYFEALLFEMGKAYRSYDFLSRETLQFSANCEQEYYIIDHHPFLHITSLVPPANKTIICAITAGVEVLNSGVNMLNPNIPPGCTKNQTGVDSSFSDYVYVEEGIYKLFDIIILVKKTNNDRLVSTICKTSAY